MKRIYGFVLAAMATAVAASCSQKLNDDAADVNAGTSGLVSMTFSALNDAAEDVVSKTHGSGRNVYWEEGDEITVFSVGDEVIKRGFTATSITKNADGNGVQATFSGLVSPAAETFYAVCPHAEGNAYEDGTFTATIPAEQVGKPNGFLSGANVSVAVSHKDGENADVLQFKNLSAVIYFKFATAEDAANTKSVTLKARKSEDDASAPEFWGLAGEVKFTLDDDNLPVVQEGTVDHVTLLPPEGGFVAGQNYIIPVCPVGDCKGMQIIFTDLNGQTYVKNNNTDFKLQRNIMFNNGGVPEPYVIMPDDDFTVKLDFSDSWPFGNENPIVSADKQVSTKAGDDGEYYPYNYEFTNSDGKSGKIMMQFGVKAAHGVPDGGAYTYESGFLKFGSVKANETYGMLRVPGVDGWYITEIVMNTAKSTYFTVVQADTFIYTGDNAKSSTSTTPTFKFPTAPVTAIAGVSYNVRIRSSDLKIEKIFVTYSKTKPE